MSKGKIFLILLPAIAFLGAYHFMSTAFIATPKPFILSIVDAETGKRIHGAEVLLRESYDWNSPRYSGVKLEKGFYLDILNTLTVTVDVHADGYYDLGAGSLGKELTPYMPNTIALNPIRDSMEALPGNYKERHAGLQQRVVPRFDSLKSGLIGCDPGVSYGLDFSAYQSDVTVTDPKQADIVIEDCTISANDDSARFYASAPGGIYAQKIDENGFFSVDEAPTAGYKNSSPIEGYTLYFVKTKEGHFAKFNIDIGVSPKGVTPMWAYQPDGSHNVAVRVGSKESNTVCTKVETKYDEFYRDRPDLFDKESFSFCEE